MRRVQIGNSKTKFVVKIEKEVLVEAEDEDDALTVFWENWEDDLAMQNSTITTELNDYADVRKATKADIRRLGED